jgi:hypothetical protein
MPLEWSPDERGIYHALAHYTDSENPPWTALCGAELTPSLNQRVESNEPPRPSHRECVTRARLSGGLWSARYRAHGGERRIPAAG